MQMEEIKTDLAEEKDSVVKPLVSKKNSPAVPVGKKAYLLLLIPVVLGVLTGLLLFKKNTSGTVRLSGKNIQVISTPTEEGVKDAATFKDTATGILSENDGKLTAEGTHILAREGGVSQNVYLTSSVIDLSKYVGKKVQVWGETFSGQKAGWLMDVGRIKIVSG